MEFRNFHPQNGVSLLNIICFKSAAENSLFPSKLILVSSYVFRFCAQIILAHKKNTKSIAKALFNMKPKFSKLNI